MEIRALIRLASDTLHSVVYGILGTAVVQGVMAGVGLLIAGVPGAILLGLLTFFLSIVPMGPPLVWVPATVWLYQTGSTGWALFMLIWGFGVSSIDNVVKPLYTKGALQLSPLLVFVTLFGGIAVLGPIGALLGPLIAALAAAFLRIWTTEFLVDAEPLPRTPVSEKRGGPPWFLKRLRRREA